MDPSAHTNRVLTLVLVAVVVMIMVMSILMGVVFYSAASKTNIEDQANTQTSSVDRTVAALVSTMLVSTQTPQSEALAGAEKAGVEGEQGEEGESADVQLPTITISPTSQAPATPSATPEFTRTPNPWVESNLETMTLAQKVGQMILTGVNGAVMSTDTCQFVQRLSPGGIIYLSSNIDSPTPDRLASLSQGLQNCVANTNGVDLLIAIDHEGAYVNRFPYDSRMTVFPPALAIGATGNPDYAYQAAFTSGLELRANGINMVLGPVADVLTNYENTVISQRAYGGDPSDVGIMVSNAVQGYLAAGILPVLKHYPGHGDVSGDSHTTLPVDQADRTRLLNTHLVPFQAGIDAGAPAVMVSHVAFPGVDPQNLPASLSAPLYQILVEDMAFQGFTMSDSMGMGAIGSTGLGVEAASVKAINAGLDMLMLISPDLAESVHSSIVWAVQNGEIPVTRIDQAVRRILEVKYIYGLEANSSQGVSTPDWDQNAALSYQIGYQAVSLLRDQDDLVPIPNTASQVLIVGPADGWGLYPLLRSALDQKGIVYNIMTYSDYWFGPVPETSYLQTVPTRAQNYDLVIVFTWDSHPNRYRFGDTFQGQLVNTLLDGGHRPVVIALKSPTDILDFPGAPTYLASMGTTRGQLQGIVDILVGGIQPGGKIPLPELP